MNGGSASSPLVLKLGKNGFTIALDDRELFLAFEHFPWFRDASIRAIHNVERPSPHHSYWPDLDIDLHVESIEYPERYPLKSR